MYIYIYIYGLISVNVYEFILHILVKFDFSTVPYDFLLLYNTRGSPKKRLLDVTENDMKRVAGVYVEDAEDRVKWI